MGIWKEANTSFPWACLICRSEIWGAVSSDLMTLILKANSQIYQTFLVTLWNERSHKIHLIP